MGFWSEYLEPALRKNLDSIMGILPEILAAVVILVLGWIVARLIAGAVHRLLRKIGFDDAGERAGLSAFLRNAGLSRGLSWLVGRLVFWMLMFVVLLSAAESLHLDMLADALGRLVSFIPNLVAVVLILVLGTLVARVLGSVVRGFAANAGFDFAELLGKVVNYVTIFAISVIALSQLQIQSGALEIAFAAFLGAGAVAVALVLGLGSKDVARNIISGVYARKMLSSGDVISVDGLQGRITEIGAVNTTISTTEGDVLLIPNRTLTDSVTRLKTPSAANSERDQ